MSNGFTFNVQEAIEQMEYCTTIDLAHQELTMFGFMCINGDGVSSHGGQIVAVPNGRISEMTVDPAINEAIAAAVDINAGSPEGHTCKYVPVAFSFPTHLLPALQAQLLRDPRVEAMVLNVEELDDDD